MNTLSSRVDKLRQRVWLPGHHLFVVHVHNPRLVLIQIRTWAPCNHTGEPGYHYGRQWAVTDDMPDLAIVRTMYAAWKAWVLHEASEQFKLDNVAIFEHTHN